MMTHPIHLLLTLLTIIPLLSYAKVSSGKALLNGENSEALLTKFAVSAGTRGWFDLTLTIPPSRGMYMDERFLRLHLFADEAWTKKAAKATTCDEKTRYANKALGVTFDYKAVEGGNDKEKVWLARVETFDLISDGDKPRYWYITLDDCSLEYTNHRKEDVPEMDFTYTIRNGDGKGGYTHFSADELGINKLHVFQILFSSLLLFCIAAKIMKAMMDAHGQVHIALITVGFALQMDILSCLSEMIHAGTTFQSHCFDYLSFNP